MSAHTTTIAAIHGPRAQSATERLGWLRLTAAYLLPTLATGAGCYLALATVARVLGAMFASPPVPPH